MFGHAFYTYDGHFRKVIVYTYLLNFLAPAGPSTRPPTGPPTGPPTRPPTGPKSGGELCRKSSWCEITAISHV